MVATGIIEPAKVTRSALQNAASIAALFLTTEAVIADKPEKAGAGLPGAGSRAAVTWTSDPRIRARRSPEGAASLRGGRPFGVAPFVSSERQNGQMLCWTRTLECAGDVACPCSDLFGCLTSRSNLE